MEYYSVIKIAKNTSICSNMDGSRDCHNEWSTSDTERYIMWYHFYVESKKKVQIDIYKIEAESQM